MVCFYFLTFLFEFYQVLTGKKERCSGAVSFKVFFLIEAEEGKTAIGKTPTSHAS